MGDEVHHLITAARRQGEVMLAEEPRASGVSYDSASKRLSVRLSNGSEMLVPIRLIEGLASARDDDIAAVEVAGVGFGLHWERLDLDLSVAGLAAGVFGTRKWMDRQRAAHAGAVRSVKKALAARTNGTKGGRPRKAAG